MNVKEIKVSECVAFQDNPFQVKDDEGMELLVQSIREFGVMTPVVVRPVKEGGYEIISGHRRLHACRRVGIEMIPALVRDMERDSAVIFMVDSNIQREDILPSEKAKAYRMKYDALKHQGKKAGGRTIEEMGEDAGESAKTIQRYLWLSRLSDGLLDLVDRKKLGFMQGVDISFLTEEAQGWVHSLIAETGAGVNAAQSAKLKEYGKNGELTPAMVSLILSEEKPKERKVTLKADKITRYFPEDYSNEEIEEVIIGLLEKWKGEGAER